MQVAEGDFVVATSWGEVCTRESSSDPATNREVETNRVRDGKIVEYWSVVDVARLLQQVGANTLPSSAPLLLAREQPQGQAPGA
jgi:predicted SnoaL-like aldol condensation-catalyzing enzyme